MIPLFINFPISPWSLKPRWALHYYQIDHRQTNYFAGLMELWLRWKLWQWSGRVTVPVLITPSGNLTDGIDIARWADAHTTDRDLHSLFPQDRLDDIRRWEQRCNAVMQYNRGQFLQFSQASADRYKHFSPRFLLSLPFGEQLARIFGGAIIRHLNTKYADLSSATTLEQAKATVLQIKDTLQRPNDYLLGTFTYADISAAVLLQGLRMVIGIGTPDAQSLAQLVDSGLQQWQDKMYQHHFPPKCPLLGA